ncbi:unnamed protein product [Adineta steineri]|uniref:Methyltransferase domain-containing protein n=1 Tax=Adineta steineri TaxID=433720 RepID=A0A815X1E6_9BILA|nr:unnamed protein product [Adineta steineri]CAF1662036.1 unnamed protein product [Adineta steineri]
MANKLNESDYDQNSLAEKFIAFQGLNFNDSVDKHNVMVNFDTDYILFLIKRGLSYVKLNFPVECALDVGCGAGNICRFLIEEKLAEYVVGVDNSHDMLKYAKAGSNDDTVHYNYVNVNVATDDLITVVGKKVPLIVQTYMLIHAETSDQLLYILSNIAKVSCGLFVGIIPNPNLDLTSDAAKKLIKYGTKFTLLEEENSVKDGMAYQVTYEHGTPGEITLVDHWYSAATYERLFEQAGFKFLEWVPVEAIGNKDNASLADLTETASVIGFIVRKM